MDRQFFLAGTRRAAVELMKRLTTPTGPPAGSKVTLVYSQRDLRGHQFDVGDHLHYAHDFPSIPDLQGVRADIVRMEMLSASGLPGRSWYGDGDPLARGVWYARHALVPDLTDRAAVEEWLRD